MDGWKLEDYSTCIYIYSFLLAQNTYVQVVFAVSFRESLPGSPSRKFSSTRRKSTNSMKHRPQKHGEKPYGFPTYPSSVGVKEFRPIFTPFVWRLFRHVSDTTKEGIQFAYWKMQSLKFQVWTVNKHFCDIWHCKVGGGGGLQCLVCLPKE